MKTTWVIEGRANTVIKHKALIYQDKRPPRISSYGRIKFYPPMR